MSARPSGSTQTRWEIQREGMAVAVEDPGVIPRDSSVTFSVVQFAGGARGGAIAEIQPTVIDSEATATTLATAIRALPLRSGGTPMAAGIDLAASLFSANRQNRQIICITNRILSVMVCTVHPLARADLRKTAGSPAERGATIAERIG
jgi:hypothetical protein